MRATVRENRKKRGRTSSLAHGATDDRRPRPDAKASQPFIPRASSAAAPKSRTRSPSSASSRHPQARRKAVKRSSIPQRGAFYVSASRRAQSSYKGMLTKRSSPAFYPDLRDTLVESALALVHSRFFEPTRSRVGARGTRTATRRTTARSHAARHINWMRARESRFRSRLVGEDLHKVLPVIDTDAAIRGCSTTCWRCSRSPAARSRTR